LEEFIMTTQNVFNYGDYVAMAEGENKLNFLKEGKLNIVLQTPESTIFGRIIDKEAKTCEITFMAIKQEYAKETKATIVSEWDDTLVNYSNGAEPQVIIEKREKLAEMEAEREAKDAEREAEKARKEEEKAAKEAERLAKRQQREEEKAAKAAQREAERLEREAKRQEEKAKKEAEKAAKAAAVKATVEAAVVSNDEGNEEDQTA
jgi:hypothetical protein